MIGVIVTLEGALVTVTVAAFETELWLASTLVVRLTVYAPVASIGKTILPLATAAAFE